MYLPPTKTYSLIVFIPFKCSDMHLLLQRLSFFFIKQNFDMDLNECPRNICSDSGR